MPTITIDSILGGHAPTSHFASKDQFMVSLGIDPGQSAVNSVGGISYKASGVLRPAAATKYSGSTIKAAPLWMKSNPKDGNIYVLDANGSTYTTDGSTTVTGLSDGGNESAPGSGNGMEYYDNYIYEARNTTIARYGPLNGSPSFNGDYWGTTLGKASLTNTTYPVIGFGSLQLPNHYLHRHSDGRLYIADVSGNQGAIHFISTKKTTVEGDTDNGSQFATAGVGGLIFGYGLWPTCMESYGNQLVIAVCEGIQNTNLGHGQVNAKIAFWDGTSNNFNSITWVEFPDPIISAIKNVNGILYVISGNQAQIGFRISQYVGGSTFQEVHFVGEGYQPLPGAIDGQSDQLVFGTATSFPEAAVCVYSLGLVKSGLATRSGPSGSQGLFNIMRGTNTTGTGVATSIILSDLSQNFYSYKPVIGWSDNNNSLYGIDAQLTAYSNAPSVWWSQMYRIPGFFRIRRIGLPLSQQVGANMTITPKIYIDNGTNVYTITAINNTTFPNNDLYANLQTGEIFGFNNFWLELRWTGSALLTVELPIEIEYEEVELP